MTQKQKSKCPGYAEFFLDVLKVIAQRGGSASIDEILDDIIARRNFPDAIVDQMHTGSTVMTELEYQLAWTRTYLVCRSVYSRGRLPRVWKDPGAG